MNYPTAEQVENIPASLRSIPRWVTWHKYQGSKVPTNRGGNRGFHPSNSPEILGSFAEMLAAAQRSNQGVGFYFDDDDVMGVDLDHCIEAGVLNGSAQKIVDALDSYTEVSPSGTGLHVIVLGTMPAPEIKAMLAAGAGNAATKVEMYSRGACRYFTITGDCGVDAPSPVENRQGLVTQLYNEAVKVVKKGSGNSSGNGDYFELPAVIEVDARHDTLLHFGGSLRHYGFERKEIVAAALALNANRERMPAPLDPRELSGYMVRAVKSFKGTPQELPGTLLEVGWFLRSRYNLALCEMIPILEAVKAGRDIPLEPNPSGDKEAFEEMLVTGDSK